MSVSEHKTAEQNPTHRWFYPGPHWVLLCSIIATSFLFFSEGFHWFSFNTHKGWTVLVALATTGVFLLLIVVWFVVAFLFRIRFQFSIRSLLALVTVVAVSFSWLATESQRAKRQKETVDAIRGAEGCEVYYELDPSRPPSINTDPSVKGWHDPPTPTWIETRLGTDFFHPVEMATVGRDQVGEVVPYIKRLHGLRTLYVYVGDEDADALIEKLASDFPDVTIAPIYPGMDMSFVPVVR